MDLLNGTKMVAGYTLGVEPSAREHLVVVVKGTFDFPANGGEPTLAEEQAPFVYADTFTGKPGFSAPLDECDFAFRKPRCDVLLNGAAYAPDGKPATPDLFDAAASPFERKPPPAATTEQRQQERARRREKWRKR